MSTFLKRYIINSKNDVNTILWERSKDKYYTFRKKLFLKKRKYLKNHYKKKKQKQCFFKTQ